MEKFTFFNDTGRVVNVHPATTNYADCSEEPIKHLETRTFTLVRGKGIRVKMWDYGSSLQIFVSAENLDEEESKE